MGTLDESACRVLDFVLYNNLINTGCNATPNIH